ncbi:arsenic metallochaperone ArsD family protein [bacterium]|nr:arsenic metallochaperone ArsD family protein [bacterium]
MPTLTVFEASNSLLNKEQRMLRLDVDLFQLEDGGTRLLRYNFIDHPEAFARHPQVMAEMGQNREFLPIVMVDDRIVSKAVYPSRQQLADWARVPMGGTGGCGGGGGCSCGG